MFFRAKAQKCLQSDNLVIFRTLRLFVVFTYKKIQILYCVLWLYEMSSIKKARLFNPVIPNLLYNRDPLGSYGGFITIFPLLDRRAAVKFSMSNGRSEESNREIVSGSAEARVDVISLSFASWAQLQALGIVIFCSLV